MASITAHGNGATFDDELALEIRYDLADSTPGVKEALAAWIRANRRASRRFTGARYAKAELKTLQAEGGVAVHILRTAARLADDRVALAAEAARLAQRAAVRFDSLLPNPSTEASSADLIERLQHAHP